MKRNINSPRFAVIHIAKSLEKAIARTKLVKEYASPNTLAEMKIAVNLKDKMTEMKESQPLTKAIRKRKHQRKSSPVVLHADESLKESVIKWIY